MHRTAQLHNSSIGYLSMQDEWAVQLMWDFDSNSELYLVICLKKSGCSQVKLCMGGKGYHLMVPGRNGPMNNYCS